MPDSSDEIANPVNAAILEAELELVTGSQIWLRLGDELTRAWAPAGTAEREVSGTSIEVYLDADGCLNGWRDPDTGLAINQRRMDPAKPPRTGTPMACQGDCGLVWIAPAGEELSIHGERCLTCAGPLVPQAPDATR